MCFFIFHKGSGELIRARGIAFAFNAFKGSDDLVDVFSVNQTGNALKITAATSDEFYVTNLTAYDVVKNLSRAGSFSAVGVHFFPPLFNEIFVKQVEYEHAFFFPALVNVFCRYSARHVHFKLECGMRGLDYF